ncbi:MAG: glycoside hydrolase family 127 protein [Chloroflexi bacterium]|nr:glycoside hydrolase family 127 protein [Chloroflexota bacterium]OJV91898.1 MAG: hypothetical protein BGO39_14325 [Chloroflexi bacterium 54-19]
MPFQTPVPIPLQRPDVRIDDPFWSPRLETFRTVTLPDVFTKFEQDHEGAFTNFDWVRDGAKGHHVGPPWYDGLIYETIRAASDFLADTYDTAIDARIDGYISRFQAAQDADPDGYLNTYTTLVCPEYRWGMNGGNLIWQHELYNAGCLTEAAVHHYRALGKTNLLRVAVRMANLLVATIGPAPWLNIVPAHSLPEEALVKLHRLFRDFPEAAAELGVKDGGVAYLDLARFWVEHRGRHEDRASYPRYMGEYAQDHRPVREQAEAVGHAVRATLFYTGIVAVAVEDSDATLLRTSEKLWDNAVHRKLHISGGVGAVHNEEKFGYEYQLPNDAYLETCAAVGMGFWSGALAYALTEAKYADTYERILYNGVLPGLSLDGSKYFYRNPLLSKGDDHRWEWHGCPCCPPMFLKFMADLPNQLAVRDAAGLIVNQYVGSTLVFEREGHNLSFRIASGLPWNGSVSLTYEGAAPSAFSLRLRIPEWSPDFTLSIGGETFAAPIQDGYAVLDRNWSPGDTVRLELTMPTVRQRAHPYVKEDLGRVALQRGPVLYCVEGLDNAGEANPLLAETQHFTETFEPGLLGGVVLVEGQAVVESREDGAPPESRPFRAVPYYAWDNREASPMNVWLRQDGPAATDRSLEGWEGKLYRPI